MIELWLLLLPFIYVVVKRRLQQRYTKVFPVLSLGFRRN